MTKYRGFFAALLLLFSLSLPAQEKDLSLPEGCGRPRLLLSAGEMDEFSKSFREPTSADYKKLSAQQLKRADSFVSSEKIPQFTPNGSGSILLVSRDALDRLLSCSWAYRMTGERKYLDYCDSILGAVCDFPTWHPEHFLDVAEMALAVSIAYDWLYEDLSDATKQKAAGKLYEFALKPSLDEQYSKQFADVVTNWNQVCHAGLAAAAIATYEEHPEESRAIIERAVQKNRKAVEHIYSPDGVYPEGAGYWTYGTSYQIVLNTMLQSVYGTDFALSEVPGFSNTWKFFMYSQDNLGKKYDYSEGNLKGSVFAESWYFASRFGADDATYLVRRALQDGKPCCKHRLSPLNLIFASKVAQTPLRQPSEKVFCGRSDNPILVARSGWSKDDVYLGVKAGKGRVNHGHLDVGSFIYESQGVRWITEIHLPGGYEPLRAILRDLGHNKGLFSLSDNSPRWTIFSYTNKEHSTLTINDRNHDPKASCGFSDVNEEGGTIDLTPLFGKDVKKAVRRFAIKKNSYLEITDTIQAPDTADVHVRFNLVTECDVDVSRGGLLLSKKSRCMQVKASGAKVEYRTWSADPHDYPGEINARVRDLPEGFTFCGYTYTVPKGAAITITTTLKDY